MTLRSGQGEFVMIDVTLGIPTSNSGLTTDPVWEAGYHTLAFVTTLITLKPVQGFYIHLRSNVIFKFARSDTNSGGTVGARPTARDGTGWRKMVGGFGWFCWD